MEYLTQKTNQEELSNYVQMSQTSLSLVDDVICKKYLPSLVECDIVPLNEDSSINDIRIFKINKMVYAKDEYATDKFNSVISSMAYANASIFLIVDSQETKTDFYFGVRIHDDNRTAKSVADTLEQALKGHFPGIQTSGFIKNDSKDMMRILSSLESPQSISCVTGIPTAKNKDEKYTNPNFIQGIEKLVLAMQGKVYTAVIIASNNSTEEIQQQRSYYEKIYSAISNQTSQQVAYSTNESLSDAVGRTTGSTTTQTTTRTEGSSESDTKTSTKTNSVSASHGTSKSTTITEGITTTVSDSIANSETNTVNETSNCLRSLWSSIVGGKTGTSSSTGKTTTQTASNANSHSVGKTGGTTDTMSESQSDSHSIARMVGTNKSTSEANSTAKSTTNSQTRTIQTGESKTITLTIQNKQIDNILKLIDRQIERINACGSTGIWATGAYFLSTRTNDKGKETAEQAAAIYRAIMQGDSSDVEIASVNTWMSSDANKVKELSKYIHSFKHPEFIYKGQNGQALNVTATSMLSSKEVALAIGLPRNSVQGLPVSEYVPFAKEVVKLGNTSLDEQGKLSIGVVFEQNDEIKGSEVKLNIKSLTQHTFVTGSTGCGKSETIYKLISDLQSTASCLIIEPAKGEYKNVFGKFDVYDTNPQGNVLRINPFAFPTNMHVLDHIDRLIDIFGVCWPMYAAMPAVLRDAILLSYRYAGWNLDRSICKYSNAMYPTFGDLKKALLYVIEQSDYSAEVKSNYKGSLLTRINSLTNGLYSSIFTPNELSNEDLFEKNCIVDLSQLGNPDSRSLIMALLTMRLYEYRKYSNIPLNSNLRHITILEEAHSILPRCSQEQNMEGSNVKGKSVEMISSAIAEMRTYGEGFIIVDQAPGAVDISAIRNTNTKIIMRLPEMDDRKVAGKSAAMNDSQIDQIAKLPTGVAAIYQNDWEAPLLCLVSMFDGERIKYNEDANNKLKECQFFDTIRFLLHERIDSTFIIETVEKELQQLNISSASRKLIYKSLEEYQQFGEFKTLNNDNFPQIASIVSEILNVDNLVEQCVDDAVSISDLNEELSGIIPEQLNDIKLSISQCLMQIYAKTDERLHIYSEWFKEVCI